MVNKGFHDGIIQRRCCDVVVTRKIEGEKHGDKCWQTPVVSTTAGRLAPSQVAENCALQSTLDTTRHGSYSTGPAYPEAVIDASPSKLEYMYGACSETESPCHGSHPVFIRGRAKSTMDEIPTVPVFLISRYQHRHRHQHQLLSSITRSKPL